VTSCRKINSITSSNLDITELVHLIYLLLNDSNYRQIKNYYGVSNGTISSIKNKLKICYDLYCNERQIFLGGLDRIVEADETVLSRRGIIKCPTATDDEKKDTIWIFGAIDLIYKSQFILKRIKNRQVETITEAIDGEIGVLSKFHTDGHPSYPGVAENLCLKHKVVIHSKGFISSDGTHTNNIEGFWSHLKASMRKEHGVKRVNIDKWISEYTFRRRFLMTASRE
ncbi:hypothetical protein DMUE_6317, partial [Dictyocoela muelleri]